MFFRDAEKFAFYFPRTRFARNVSNEKTHTHVREKIPIFDQRFCQTVRSQAIDDRRIPEQ